MTDDLPPKPEPIATVTAEDVIWKDEHDGVVEFEADKALAVLLAHGLILVNSSWWRKDWPEEAREHAFLHVMCSDVFAWGVADALELPFSGIEDLYRSWLADPVWGTAVWCMKTKKTMPQRPVEDVIRKAGIWDLDSMGLGPNPHQAAIEAWAAEKKARTEAEGAGGAGAEPPHGTSA